MGKVVGKVEICCNDMIMTRRFFWFISTTCVHAALVSSGLIPAPVTFFKLTQATLQSPSQSHYVLET